MKHLILKVVFSLALIMSISAEAANAIIENEYVKAGVNESTGTLGSGGATRPGLQYDNTGTHTWPSDSYTDLKAEVSYAVNKTSRIALSADRQEHNSLSTDTVGLYGKINF